MTDPGSGRLVLVATPIGNLDDGSIRMADVLRNADVIAAEDTRSARVLLNHLGIAAGTRLIAVHDHNEAAASKTVVEHIRAGRTVAYISDAGMPGVSDPGARLVAAVVAAHGVVEVVPGPSAAVAALVVSGLPTDGFLFLGFLDRKGSARTRQLHEVATSPHTVVLFESPRRIAATLADLADLGLGARPVALARELTKRYEEVVRGTVDELRARYEPEAPRGECVLVIAGAPPAITVTDDALADALDVLLADGLSARDAAAELADAYGVGKRRVYELAVARGRLTQ